ncbi:hypothetical protein E2320_002609 [Naja naja]|nr:hypothetical protein E2320_002609 [Naja naja]
MAFFLNWVWAHMGRYVPAYPDEVTMVNAITANLEGSKVLELGNINAFLVEFKAEFEDEIQL